jgi:hypothetical protein
MWPSLGEEIQQRPDVLFCLGGVPHRCVSVDEVVVTAPDPPSLQDACVDQVSGYALGGAFGDAHRLSDIPETGFAVFGDAEQYLGVIREERPVFGRMLG